MDTTGLKKKKEKFVLNSICFSDYGVETKNNKEKLEAAADAIKEEALYTHNIKRFGGNMQMLIADYLMGLPSWLNIPFHNQEILELYRGWGYAPKNEKEELKIIDRYWADLAGVLLRLMERYDVSLKRGYK